MEQIEMPSSLKRTVAISLLLTFIGTFASIAIGSAASNINNETKVLEGFLTNSQNIGANFEQSLKAYTQNTQTVIDFLLSLRPSDEKEYIKFISEVEEIGQELSLEVNLKTLKIPENPENPEKSMLYGVKLWGTEKNMMRLLKEIEELPYMIKTKNIDFKNPEFAQNNDGQGKDGNIEITLQLYTK